MFTKEEAYAKIADLVERFSLQIDSYKKSDYNETLTRQDFINPFFKALGWDIDNSQGNAEAYREVIHEDKLKIGSATKAPDYSFRLPGGKRLFFVEAKKPSVLVKEDIVPAYQVRRYGWSAKLPISLITDFEEFAVYDCTKKPNPYDKASAARIKYFTYKQYLDEFDFIWDTFSKASVLKGSFDKFIVSDTYKKGTTTVDKEFLASLDEWRILLAQNIALRNQNFTEDELNFVVQQTLDRIIFLRIAEDRGVEGYGELKDTLTKSKEEGAFYKGLFQLFKEADSKYNSGLFDFKKDKLSANVAIDNKVIKTIISALYYPECPYEFSVLGVEILGSAYEQFLGKQIKLSAGHKAIIEEKPEVRKAGGVYYTPQYIVDYIVQNTVGKLTEGKTPEQVAQLKIVDPACGSGSFLIGAYTYLLNWHLNYYKPEFIKHSEIAADNNTNTKTREAAIKQRNKLPLTPEGNLSTALKKQILLNNIYGVDIDTQAVEVTKLSLLLKCMEGETGSSINAQMRFGERVLPTLDDNIKSGNSLIDVDFYDTEFDFGEEKKIKPFNWQQAFPNVFKQGGFDVVIGNPPYGFHQIHAEIIKPYFKTHFFSSQGSFEHYFLFYERTLKLLTKEGLHGFIVPVTWLTIPSAKSLRKFLLDNFYLKEICWLPEKVFKNAQVNTLISITQKAKIGKTLIKIYDELGFIAPPKNQLNIEQIKFINSDYYIGIFENDVDENIITKILNTSQPLKEICRPCSGYNPYEVGKGIAPDGKAHTIETVKTKPYHSETQKSQEWKPEIIGRDLSRYNLIITGKRWIKYGPWLSAARDPQNFFGKRILVQEITGGKEKRIVATYYDQELYHSRDIIAIKIENDSVNPYFILGLINSKLISWYHHKRNPKAQKGLFPKILVSDLGKLPIKKIDFPNKSEKSVHNEIVQLVETMLQLNKEKQQTTTPDKLEQLNTRIQYTDDKINKLVYQLYGLSDEEIAIVEGK